MKTKDEIRFWSKVDRSGDCWEWMAYRLPKGYGTMRIANRRKGLAHRISWEIHFGPIPTGMHVLHKCDNPPCVNPDHLMLGTAADNIHDMVDKGRHSNQRKTHCKWGHPFDEENTRMSRGARTCRQCGRKS